jgi:hypothetical protein
MGEKERIEYQCMALSRLGIDGVLNSISSDCSAFKQGRVWNTERSMLLCGSSINLTSRGHASRLTWLLAGAIVRYLIPSKIKSFRLEIEGRDELARDPKVETDPLTSNPTD